MKRTPRGKVDPIEHQIELALRPGVFIGDRECFAFVSRLDEIAIQISKLVGIDTGRATSLYEAFLAGCHEKAGEVDDSSGSFGQFAQDLICGWIRARASNPDADETATRLLAWMEDDPFAFCYQIEKDVAKAFNKAGLAAFEKHIRKRFEEAVAAKPAPDTPLGDQPDYVRKHWSEVLRTIYATQRNVAAYITLAEETGLTAQDCHTLATLFVVRRKPNEALGWGGAGDYSRQRETPPVLGQLRPRQAPTRAIDEAWPGR